VGLPLHLPPLLCGQEGSWVGGVRSRGVRQRGLTGPRHCLALRLDTTQVQIGVGSGVCALFVAPGLEYLRQRMGQPLRTRSEPKVPAPILLFQLPSFPARLPTQRCRQGPRVLLMSETGAGTGSPSSHLLSLCKGRGLLSRGTAPGRERRVGRARPPRASAKCPARQTRCRPRK
jgi:hypothetical protein